MAYIDVTSLHALPTNQSRPTPPPAAILFPRGPVWQHRYMRNIEQDRLNTRFMYQDQGPPMYRLLGQHCNMYTTPNKSDHSAYSKSFHYEPRHYNAPAYRNKCVAYPNGPPPAQVALFDGCADRVMPPNGSLPDFPGRTIKSYKQYDQYRYLPGPPHESQMYGKAQGWDRFPVLS